MHVKNPIAADAVYLAGEKRKNRKRLGVDPNDGAKP
jgi:hypothetical protein